MTINAYIQPSVDLFIHLISVFDIRHEGCSNLLAINHT